MLLNIHEPTSLYVNQLSLNYTFNNRKAYTRKKKTPFKYPSPIIMDERISITEHLNILNEYQDELKYISLNQKNSESIDNTQSLKDSSTRDSDIVICVESKSPETEKNDDFENYDLKKFKLQNNHSNDNKVNIFNLLNLNNSIVNKNFSNNTKISNLVDVAGNESKKNNSYDFKSEKNIITFDNIKKIFKEKDQDNGNIKKYINKYYHFNFKHGSMEKLVEKINNILVNKNSNKFNLKNDSFNINNKINEKSPFKNKKDSILYSNLLLKKMNNNNYDSALSLTCDKDYFNIIKSIYNKFSLNGNMIDKNLKDVMMQNNKLLESFKKENKEKADKYDFKILKDIINDKHIRKKVKSNFRFMKHISEKNFYNFLEEYNSKNISESLTDDKEKSKNNFENFDNNNNNFFLLVYFLLGINYINKSQINLSENDLLSLIPTFMKLHQPKIIKKKQRIFKKGKSKKAKINNENNDKTGRNIIRINLEELFNPELKNEKTINLIEDNEI